MKKNSIIFMLALLASGFSLFQPGFALTLVNSCRTLSVAGETYQLTADVSSSGTCFTVGANNIVLDGNGHIIRYASGPNVGYAVRNNGFDGITIRNFANIIQVNSSLDHAHAIYANGMTTSTIRSNTMTINGDYGAGIRLDTSSSNNILSNIVSTTRTDSVGIYLTGSDSNTISGNTINTPGWSSEGIYLDSSDFTTVSGNRINTGSDYGYGIRLRQSTRSSISGNIMNTQEDYAIYIEPTTTASDYSHTISTTNTENGNPIYYCYAAACPATISPAALGGLNNLGQLYVANRNGIRISSMTVRGDGITLALSSNARITGSTVSPAREEDRVHGIYLHSGSDSAEISDNSITTRGYMGYGIYLRYVRYANIAGNAMSTQNSYAIYIEPTTSPSYYNHAISTTNTEYGAPIYYYYAKSFPFAIQNLANVGQLYVANSTGIVIRNVKVVRDGITFGMTRNSNITDSIITAQGAVAGIFLHSDSYGNTLLNNTIKTSGGGGAYGVYLWSSDRNKISKNRINTSYTWSWSDYGIYLYRGSDSNVISDNQIVTSGSSSHGIYSDTWYPNNSTVISGNSITTLKSSSHGIYLPYSNNNTVSSNKIVTSNTNSYGLYLQSSDRNKLYNNSIVTSGINGYGLYFLSSDTNNITNNSVITSGAGGYGLYLSSSSSNNITGGSVSSASGTPDYYLENAGTSNNVTGANFTSTRRIFFADTTSWYNYNNGTGGNIWIKTRVSSPTSIVRSLGIISSNSLNWIDTGTVTATYAITGLSPLTEYDVYRTVSGITTKEYSKIKTDASGSLPQFTINLAGTTEMLVRMTLLPPPAINVQSPGNFSYATGSVWFNVTLSQAGSWAGYSLDGGANVTMANTTGNWNRQAAVTEGTHRVRFFANNTDGIMNSTSFYFFTVDITKPLILFELPTDIDNYVAARNRTYINTSVSDNLSPRNMTAFIDFGNSLAGWWRFNNEPTENSTLFRDWSGNQNNGTCSGTNCSRYTYGKFGYALQFDGADDYVRVKNAGNLNPKSVTVSAFFKSKYTSPERHILDKRDFTGGGYHLRLQGTSAVFDLLNSTGGEFFLSATDPGMNNGEWHNLVGTWDGVTQRLYYDGALVNSNNPVIDDISGSNSDLIIGHYSITHINSFTWNGAIDEIKIWNRALSPEEIRASYNAGAYRLYRNFTNLADGTYTYTAYVQDLAGNVGQTETRSLIINTATPTSSNQSLSILPLSNDITVPLGGIGRWVVKVKNLQPSDDVIELALTSNSDKLRNWIWFEGHRYDDKKNKITVTLGPNQEKAIVMNIFGGEVTSSSAPKIKIVARPVYSGSEYEALANVFILFSDDGMTVRTPEIGWGAFAIIAAMGALMLFKNIKIKSASSPRLWRPTTAK